MCLIEGADIAIPDSIDQNTNVTSVKARLNQLAKLPSLDMNLPDMGDGFRDKPSFRDMAAFNFQPQYIIANPTALYFKADTFEHQQKLKTIFPLVLGSETAKTIELKHELKLLEVDREKLKRQRDEKIKFIDTWKLKLKTIYLQAYEKGLVDEIPADNLVWDTNNYINKLKKIPAKLKELYLPVIPKGATERIVREINNLRNEEISISRKIDSLKHDLVTIEKIDASKYSYQEALETKKDRLQSIGWFSNLLNSSRACPVCGSNNGHAKKSIDKLLSIAQELEQTTKSLGDSSVLFDKERTTLKREIDEHEMRLNEIRTALNELKNESDDANKENQSFMEVFRFVGNIEKYLEEISSIEEGDRVSAGLNNLEEKIISTKAMIDYASIKKRQAYAIQSIGTLTTNYLSILEAEHRDRPVSLDIGNLTLKISSPNGREDYLWEIGSGANYMAYHVSLMLSLHKYFLSNSNSPVPSFLIIDQPSQVYFPEGFSDIDSLKRNKNKKGEKEKIDRDLLLTQKIFEALQDAFVKSDKKLQLIVIEHAGNAAWKKVEKNIFVAANWHNEEALIPKGW